MIFPSFGSPLAHLKTELELFEVCEDAMMVMMICRTIISQTSHSSGSGSKQAREEQKEENHLNTISKMMVTIVQALLYTSSSR